MGTCKEQFCDDLMNQSRITKVQISRIYSVRSKRSWINFYFARTSQAIKYLFEISEYKGY